MKVIRRSPMGMLILVSLFGIASFTPFGPMPAQGDEASAATCHRRQIDAKCSTIPHNPTVSLTLPSIGVSNFAWKTFIALNWPADCSGEPMTDKKIGEAAGRARVWEFYRTSEEIFLPDGKNPTTIQPTLPWPCRHDQQQPQPPLRLRLAEAFLEVQHDDPYVYDSLDMLEQDLFRSDDRCPFGPPPGTDKNGFLCRNGELIKGISMRKLLQANAIPLVDQDGNYIVNVIRVNPVAFNQIVRRGWYQAKQLSQDAAKLKDGQFLAFACSKRPSPNFPSTVPCGEGDDQHKYDQEGAIQLKIAWRILTPREAQQGRYFTTKRTFSIPPENNATGQQASLSVDVGLVGFHIMSKTSTMGWVWASFEHIDSAPVHPEARDQKPYLFYNPDCQGAHCDPDQIYVKKPYLWDTTPGARQTAVTCKDPDQQPPCDTIDQIPAQLLRFRATDKPFPESGATIRKHNKQWRKALKAVCENHPASCDASVWPYYRLAGVQWLRNSQNPYDYCAPDNRGPNGCKIPSPRGIVPTTPLTIVSLEPYTQKVSCIVCHTVARLPVEKVERCNIHPFASKRGCADFSFILGDAK